MSWKDILKAPYTISKPINYRLVNPVIVGYETTTYDELYQGYQGSEILKHWTAEVMEAVAYAFFGSNLLGYDTPKQLKNKGKPKVRVTIRTSEDVELDEDVEFPGEIFDSVDTKYEHKHGSARIHRVGVSDSLRYRDIKDEHFIELAKKLYEGIEQKKEEVTKYIGSTIGVEPWGTYSIKGDTKYHPWRPALLEHINKLMQKHYGVRF